MRKTLVTGVVVGLIAAGFAACGDSDTTTVIQSTPAPAAGTTTTVTDTQANEPAPQETTTEATAPQGEPPDVVGLTLPEAKNQLKEAGFKADVSNTDTAFGIIVEANYTVCEQDEPRGDVVPILAQKYGCED
jgi:ABC-type glycerol-3-phosphate transport system substrate-binding protein